ncbi:sensor histidine kinase [Iodobacter fluviatilis]|uniref:histidine kinase n=1 Tax=Iodobacter fluviatilis TaxID=537 RepID=A0A377Q616_9NEIS|nr:HAMP domain-containing sensor histidine kinase [Iodobacter fluviatilis]TCU89346.1 two-component system sensor histidine kinase GlrK [Iodobacter fluviatilis]STQ90716.1 Sensor histidine kinase QseE [Iodobacter fluviatilis]
MLRYFSFRTLLIVGFALVALTPSAALVQLRYGLAGLTIKAQQQQDLASDWSNASQQSQEQALHLERASRQLLILPEATFLNAAHSAKKRLEAAQQTFSTHPLLRHSSQRILQLLQKADPKRRLNKAQVNVLFGLLNEQLKNQDQLIEQQLAQQRQQWLAEVGQKQKQVDQLAILSPVAALSLAILMAVMFSWPIGQLKRKITQLAQGQRGQSWHLAGPADLQGLAKSLAELDLRLVALEAQKAQFFRHVSHELKTPLAVIHEASSLLQEEVLGHLNQQQKEISAMVQSNVQTLRQRVDALLAHDAGRWLSAGLEISPLDIEQFLAQRLQQWRILLAKKSLRIRQSGVARTTSADHAKLGIILDNLLLNAIRFSPPEGEIAISYGQTGQQSWIKIQDQGPGVASEEAESIFEPFHCGPAPEGESAGSGIGLTMARSFAQLMHGDVELIPSQQGACFRLHWQLQGQP